MLTVDAATVPGEEPAKPPLPTEVVPDTEWLWVGSVTVAVCVWLTTIASALPPVAATEYVLPAPITNRFVKFGVLLVPSHNAQPLGIETIDPLHIMMPPDGNDAGNAADTHAVPLLDKTLPDVPGETVVTAEVPLPINTPAEVRVAAPVPPFTT